MELVVQSGPDAGKVFQVGQIPLVAGRQPGVDIVLNDWQVSRRHASFELVNGALLVNDLGSANGTLVNGQRLLPNQPRPLSPNDRIQLGSTILVVAFQPAIPGPVVTPGTPGLFQPANNYAQPPAPPVYPAPGYQPLAGGFQVPQGVAPAPIPAVAASGGAKRGGNRLLVGGVIGILVVAAVAIGVILLVGGKNSSSDSAAIFMPAPGSQASPTAAASLPTVTIVTGVSGSNALPPAPPVATPTPDATPVAVATPGGSGVENGKPVNALGLTVTFPADWKTAVDEGKNILESSAPDGVTYSQVRRLSGLKGNATDRLNLFLKSIDQSVPDLKVLRTVKANNASNTVAETYITYTDRQDQLLHRDYLLAANGSGGDTYFIRFSTDDTLFDQQVKTFNSILSTIEI
ncbi:MAG TPA: FHA domain-containing protein [Chloroflexia bacterium]|nr:FHA domain-containing protein [Chloroflexia bacterium]